MEHALNFSIFRKILGIYYHLDRLIVTCYLYDVQMKNSRQINVYAGFRLILDLNKRLSGQTNNTLWR